MNRTDMKKNENTGGREMYIAPQKAQHKQSSACHQMRRRIFPTKIAYQHINRIIYQ